MKKRYEWMIVISFAVIMIGWQIYSFRADDNVSFWSDADINASKKPQGFGGYI